MINPQTWSTLTLAQQLGNIGSELTRALSHRERGDQSNFTSSLDRATELIELTLCDSRWQHRRRELTRFSEFVNDWYQDGKEYHIPLDWLAQYSTQFGLLFRR